MSKCSGFVLFALLALIAVTGCAAGSADSTESAAEHPNDPTLLDPNATEPGLKVGDAAPRLRLSNAQGDEIDLGELYQQRAPVVVTFYRGGWCPYCRKALSAWATKLDALASAGGVLVAISPETPEHSIKTMSKAVGKDHANLIALVDAQGEAMREFRAAFGVDERTQRRYRRFGIDLSEKNMSGRWELPAPVAYVIDAQGVVRWVHADWDYEKRADPDEVIAFVRTLQDAK